MTQFYLPATAGLEQAADALRQHLKKKIDIASTAVAYRPGILGLATVHFVDKKRDLNVKRDVQLWLPVLDSSPALEWSEAETLEIQEELLDVPEEFASVRGPFFAAETDAIDSSQELRSAQKGLADWLYYNSSYALSFHAELDLFQGPDESDRDYSIRLQHAARGA